MFPKPEIFVGAGGSVRLPFPRRGTRSRKVQLKDRFGKSW